MGTKQKVTIDVPALMREKPIPVDKGTVVLDLKSADMDEEINSGMLSFQSQKLYFHCLQLFQHVSTAYVATTCFTD